MSRRIQFVTPVTLVFSATVTAVMFTYGIHQTTTPLQFLLDILDVLELRMIIKANLVNFNISVHSNYWLEPLPQFIISVNKTMLQIIV
jgi:hypothetical protein